MHVCRNEARRRVRLFRPWSLCLLVTVSAICGAQPQPQSKSVAERVAAVNTLYEEQYESDMRNFPERATIFGDYRYNDKLADYSVNGYRQRNEIDKAFLARLDAIPTEGLSDQAKLSHDLLQRILRQRIADYSFKEYEMPLGLDVSIHLTLANMSQFAPLDSTKHYEDYIARLHQVPRAILQLTEVLRAGAQDQLMPVRFIIEKIATQCDGIVAANPFLLPTTKYPATISPEDQQRLTRQITEASETDALPAYKTFATFLRTEYAPRGRNALGITSLSDGQRRYQNRIAAMTTTNMTANEIHELGLREVARIEAEMTVIAKQQGFPDLATFQASLKTNPKYIPTSPEQILDSYRRYIAQMNDKLPQLFTLMPKFPVIVEPLPSFQATSATQYLGPSRDGKRPGRVMVNTANLAHRSTVDDEATAYHEGIPGHHLQRSIEAQLTDLPSFRRRSTTFNAYTEGWGLYSEQLGKEVGFYQDPVSDYGRLTNELWRAIRLVVDTGIHAKGWTRDQVIAYFRASGAVDEPTLQHETDRYIAWPGQALAYKLGQLKFRELRERAQKELGANFDIRKFHDEMLNGGALPLDLLDQRTNEWIAVEKAKSSATTHGD